MRQEVAGLRRSINESKSAEHRTGRDFPRTPTSGVDEDHLGRGLEERRAKSFVEEIDSSQHQFFRKKLESEVYRDGWFYGHDEGGVPYQNFSRVLEHDFFNFKSTVPSFNGTLSRNYVLDWIDAVDDYFDQTNPPEDLKYKLAATKLKGEAHTWWKELQNHRCLEGKDLISSWFKMSELLFLKFSPANCSKNYLSNKQCEESDYNDSIVSYNKVSDYSVELTQAAGCCLKQVEKEKKSTESCDEEKDSNNGGSKENVEESIKVPSAASPIPISETSTREKPLMMVLEDDVPSKYNDNFSQLLAIADLVDAHQQEYGIGTQQANAKYIRKKILSSNPCLTNGRFSGYKDQFEVKKDKFLSEPIMDTNTLLDYSKNSVCPTNGHYMVSTNSILELALLLFDPGGTICSGRSESIGMRIGLSVELILSRFSHTFKRTYDWSSDIFLRDKATRIMFILCCYLGHLPGRLKANDEPSFQTRSFCVKDGNDLTESVEFALLLFHPGGRVSSHSFGDHLHSNSDMLFENDIVNRFELLNSNQMKMLEGLADSDVASGISLKAAHVRRSCFMESIHSCFVTCDIELHVELGAALLEEYAKCGHIKKEYHVIRSVPMEPNFVISRNGISASGGMSIEWNDIHCKEINSHGTDVHHLTLMASKLSHGFSRLVYGLIKVGKMNKAKLVLYGIMMNKLQIDDEAYIFLINALYAVHDEVFGVLMTESLPRNKGLDLFIDVLSTANNLKHRMAIKRKWLQYKSVWSGLVALRVYVGLPENQVVNKGLWNETRIYGHIQLMPFVDYSSFITWQTLRMCIFMTNVTCKQSDSPDPIIIACNGFHLSESKAYKQKMAFVVDGLVLVMRSSICDQKDFTLDDELKEEMGGSDSKGVACGRPTQKYILMEVDDELHAVTFSSIMKNVCEDRWPRRALKLFHNMLNGLDPPMDLDNELVRSCLPLHIVFRLLLTSGLNLTRGRVPPLAGWNDEHNANIKRKLFHKTVNGLDPPMDLDNELGKSRYEFCYFARG